MARSEINVHRTNTILYCQAFEETVAFYRELLKLPITAQKDWFVEFRLNDQAFVSVADASRTTIPAGRASPPCRSTKLMPLATTARCFWSG